MPLSLRRLGALVVVAVVVAAACGGGGNKTDDATPDTTSPATTAAPTTTAVPPPPAPLTGVPTADPAVFARPALVVKIDNAEGPRCDMQARPQVGVEQADLVYEILVEGITRFAAVFHSKLPETVGPVRSARSSDVDVIAGLGKPLFAWSGNNGNVADDLAAISGGYVNVGHGSKFGDRFYRDDKRCAPHNLFVHPADLFEAAGADGKPPKPVFAYGPTASTTATPSLGVHLTTGQNVDYLWNAATATWDRYQGGTLHTAAPDVPISPKNVVVLEVTYKDSSTPGSPQAVTIGKGFAHVYVNGTLTEGIWERGSRTEGWHLVDAAGAVIALAPGTTWVQLAMKGRSSDMTPDQAAKLTKR